MKYKGIFIVILIIFVAGAAKGQYQVPLWAPGNNGGTTTGSNNLAIGVTGQNGIGKTSDNIHRIYFGLLSPVALTTNIGVIKNVEVSGLGQNYPNPFRNYTSIPFTLARQTKATLVITDIIGRPVKYLLNKSLPSGNHLIRFNAGGLTPGIYLYQLEIDEQKLVKTMSITK